MCSQVRITKILVLSQAVFFGYNLLVISFEHYVPVVSDWTCRLVAKRKKNNDGSFAIFLEL